MLDWQPLQTYSVNYPNNRFLSAKTISFLFVYFTFIYLLRILYTYFELIYFKDFKGDPHVTIRQPWSFQKCQYYPIDFKLMMISKIQCRKRKSLTKSPYVYFRLLIFCIRHIVISKSLIQNYVNINPVFQLFN